MFDRATQIRKLPIKQRNKLVVILEDDAAWKKVMGGVRRDPTQALPCPIKYTNRHMNMVEAAAKSAGIKCSEIFLKEWGCSGEQLPTLEDLQSILIDKQLFGAADYVAKLLDEPPPERPAFGIAATVPVPTELLNARQVFATAPLISNLESEGSQRNREFVSHVENVQGIPSIFQDGSEEQGDPSSTMVQLETLPLEQALSRPSAEHIAYSLLESITNGFNDNPVRESGGRLLGKGGFGAVYLGIENNQFIAVKRLFKNNFDAGKVFQNEVKTLLGLKHPNLLHMKAYSCDGPANCVVYEYMLEGDLQERLSLEGRWKSPLPFKSRITIALGSSEGLKYLHEDHNPALVHRDVKSANILLDKNLVPKIGDFGLARFMNSGDQTSTIIGTDCYMSPEAMSGEVTIKIDVFSFGVVLLELLTSLSPMKSYGDGLDLVFFAQEMCEKSIAALLDTRAGHWKSTCGSNVSELLYKLAQDCLNDDADARPFMSSVLARLESMLLLLTNPDQ